MTFCRLLLLFLVSSAFLFFSTFRLFSLESSENTETSSLSHNRCNVAPLCESLQTEVQQFGDRNRSGRNSIVDTDLQKLFLLFYYSVRLGCLF